MCLPANYYVLDTPHIQCTSKLCDEVTAERLQQSEPKPEKQIVAGEVKG